ncbi:Trm112 family protein [Francisellaceae bacterium]|nr:Trm112 family protein [Francisellaceae bacterium]
MDTKVLEILVCPLCKGPVKLNEKKDELFCPNDKIAYPIQNNIPVMLEEEARKLTLEELDSVK